MKRCCSIVLSVLFLAARLTAAVVINTHTSTTPWKPAAKCQAAADAACNADPSVFGPTVNLASDASSSTESGATVLTLCLAWMLAAT